MARQKEFDQEKALRKAVRLFSQQGFAATSTDELMRVMNVGRQSMISEFGQRDSKVTRITRNAAQVQRHALMLTLARAKHQGELIPDANLDIMADFFESTLAGIRMAAKAGKKRWALRDIAAFAGRAYMGSDR